MYPYINFLSLSGQLSKVTLDCLSFALLRYVIGPENLRHPLMQPIKFKTMTNRDLATRVFPRFKYVVFFFAFSLAFCDNLFCFVG